MYYADEYTRQHQYSEAASARISAVSRIRRGTSEVGELEAEVDGRISVCVVAGGVGLAWALCALVGKLSVFQAGCVPAMTTGVPPVGG